MVVGGIIPPADAAALRAQGVAAVFTPADFGITAIIGRLVDEIRRARDLPPWRRQLADNGRVTTADMTTAPTAPRYRSPAPEVAGAAAPAPVLPGRPGQQPAVPGEGPGPARRPGLPGPRGRVRAAGQGGRPAHHRRRAQHRRLGRQDPGRPGQRLDHPLDLPRRGHGGRGRGPEPGLHHAAEGAGRRPGHARWTCCSPRSRRRWASRSAGSASRPRSRTPAG